MKLHVDTEAKTVAIEGKVKLANVFNYLMSWFPEEWEEWSFIPFEKTIQYKEVIVEKEVWRNPYWNPWQKTYYLGVGNDTGTPITNPCFTTSNQVSLDFNNINL